MINRISSYFKQGHERSLKAKINILGMFVLKGLSILFSLLIVPMTIDYISPYQYGIWIALSSIISWLSFFDIGFGNGLKNKFVEAISNNDKKLAKTYVSTTYAILGIIIISVWLISTALSRFVNWSSFLNAPISMANEIGNVILVVLTTFAFQFILSLVNTILTALQKPAYPALCNTLSQFIILICVFCLSKTTNGSLIKLSFIIGGANIFVLIIFSLWFYTRELKEYVPSFKYINFRYAKNLMNLGLKFFLLQIIALVYYETNNIIITKVLNPTSVTVYNVAFKYMSVISMLFMIVVTPFWSAFTEANILKDYDWMKRMTNKLRFISYLVFVIAIILVLVSPYIYQIWLDNKLIIPFELTLLMGFWQIFNVWNSLHSTLIYGVGKIKLQLISSFVIGIINLPVTIFFCHAWQLNGIVFSQILMSLSISWVGTVQLNKLLNKSAYGIWNK